MIMKKKKTHIPRFISRRSCISKFKGERRASWANWTKRSIWTRTRFVKVERILNWVIVQGKRKYIKNVSFKKKSTKLDNKMEVYNILQSIRGRQIEKKEQPSQSTVQAWHPCRELVSLPWQLVRSTYTNRIVSIQWKFQVSETSLSRTSRKKSRVTWR